MERKKPWTAWSDAEHELLTRLSREGHRPLEIAQQLGRSVAVVNKKRLDLGLVNRSDRCEVCGGPIEQLEVGRPRRYCSTDCQGVKATRKRTVQRQARIEARSEWSCLVCGGALPKDRPSRKYCSNTCNKRAWYDRDKAARDASAPGGV